MEIDKDTAVSDPLHHARLILRNMACSSLLLSREHGPSLISFTYLESFFQSLVMANNFAEVIYKYLFILSLPHPMRHTEVK